MTKIKFAAIAAIFLCFAGASVSEARNVTCRVMDQQGKIAGVYVHNAPDMPVCECSNKDIPAKLKPVCADSLKAF